MTRVIVSILFCGISLFAVSAEEAGIVCLGGNYAKPLAEHTERLYLKVDNSPRIYFLKSYVPPRRVVAGLDLASTHTVYVYFDDEVVQSWRLDFEALHSHAAHVWRAAGSWRMEAIDPASCRREAPNE